MRKLDSGLADRETSRLFQTVDQRTPRRVSGVCHERLAPKPRAAMTNAESKPVRPSLTRIRCRAWQVIAAVAVVVGATALGAWWTTEGRFIESIEDAYV